MYQDNYPEVIKYLYFINSKNISLTFNYFVKFNFISVHYNNTSTFTDIREKGDTHKHFYFIYYFDQC